MPKRGRQWGITGEGKWAYRRKYFKICAGDHKLDEIPTIGKSSAAKPFTDYDISELNTFLPWRLSPGVCRRWMEWVLHTPAY
jgi:hypothetical protein